LVVLPTGATSTAKRGGKITVIDNENIERGAAQMPLA